MADFELKSSSIVVVVSDLGAQLKSVLAPNRDGSLAEVTRGGVQYAGAVCGRFANRIANGQFQLDGEKIQLAQNEGPHHLHGGSSGFDAKVWEAKTYGGDAMTAVEFSLTSPDGDEGYPGEVRATVRYWVDQADTLGVEFKATTDSTTIMNLTNHAYWNLGDPGSDSLGDHELTLSADRYVAVDASLIPTGEIVEVANSRFDFRSGRALSAAYDHCFVLSEKPAAVLANAATGRMLGIETDHVGIQVYTADHVNRMGVALEAQGLPDAPNQPAFPSPVLNPGEVYERNIRFTFTTF